MRGGGGISSDAERGEAHAARGALGRWPDAETVLQGSMSEGLRDWDLWYRGINTIWTVIWLTKLKGPASLQFTSRIPALEGRESRPTRLRFLWRICPCLDRLGCGHIADTATGRKRVSQGGSAASCTMSKLTDISSFFQALCIIGYTIFPLVIAALLSALRLPIIPRIPVYLVLIAWSLAAGISILGGSGVVRNRVGLAVYPLLVFYIGLGALCFIT
jgi:hypothetical protein